MRILGREPSAILAVLSALTSLIATQGFPWLTPVQAAVVVSLLTALFAAINAVVVRPIAPAAFVGLVGPLAAFAAAYGWAWSAESIGALEAVVVAVLGLAAVRPQVSPTAP